MDVCRGCRTELATDVHVCPHCAMRRTGRVHERLVALDAELNRLHGNRDQLIASLRVPLGEPVPAAGGAAATPVGDAASVGRSRARLSGVSAQTLLAGSGVALLFAAAVVFAAVAWDALPGAAQLAILAGAAAAAATAAVRCAARDLDVTAAALHLAAAAVAGVAGWGLADHLGAVRDLGAAVAWTVAAGVALPLARRLGSRAAASTSILLVALAPVAVGGWLVGAVPVRELVWAGVGTAAMMAVVVVRRVLAEQGGLPARAVAAGGFYAWALASLGALVGVPFAVVGRPEEVAAVVVALVLAALLAVLLRAHAAVPGALAAAWLAVSVPAATALSVVADRAGDGADLVAYGVVVAVAASVAGRVPSYAGREQRAGALLVLTVPLWLPTAAVVDRLVALAGDAASSAWVGGGFQAVVLSNRLEDVSAAGSGWDALVAAVLAGILAAVSRIAWPRTLVPAAGGAGAVSVVGASAWAFGPEASVALACVGLLAAAWSRPFRTPAGLSAAASVSLWAVGTATLTGPGASALVSAVACVAWTTAAVSGRHDDDAAQLSAAGAVVAGALVAATTVWALVGGAGMDVAAWSSVAALMVAGGAVAASWCVPAVRRAAETAALLVSPALAGTLADPWPATTVGASIVAIVALGHLASTGAVWLSWVASVAMTLAGWVALSEAAVGVPEAYTTPAAVVLAATGAWQLRRDPESSSWRALRPGLSAALVVPVVLVASDPTQLVRPLALATGGALLLIVGMARRLAAAVVYGAGAVAAVALSQLYVAAGLVPRWVSFTVLGIGLVAASARFEAARQRLGTLRGQVDALR